MIEVKKTFLSGKTEIRKADYTCVAGGSLVSSQQQSYTWLKVGILKHFYMTFKIYNNDQEM